MKKFTSLLIGVSLVLSTALAQQPDDEQQKGKKKPGAEKTQGAQPRPAQNAPKPQPNAAAKQQPPQAGRAAKPQAPAVKQQGPANAPAAAKTPKGQTPQQPAPAGATATKTPDQNADNARHGGKQRGAPNTRNASKGAATAAPSASAAASVPSSGAAQPVASATAAPKGQGKRGGKGTKGSAASPTPAPSATAATAPSASAAPSATASSPASAAPTTPPQASASPSVASAGQTTGQPTANPAAKAKKPDPQVVQQIRAQHKNFRAQPKPQQAPPVTFNPSYRIQNSDQWQGRQYEVYRGYRPERHDRGWYHSHYNRVELIAGGYYYWNNGYWYPAWGYSPSEEYYAYDAPIYVGRRAEPPDQVIADVQAALQQMGYYRGEVDGLLGPLTREALTGYQADNGLYRTAVIDEPTLESLGLS